MEKDFTGARQPDGMGLAFEQRLSEIFFERLDLATERRLGEKDLLSRPADIALLGHRNEVPPLPQLHGPQPTEASRPRQPYGLL